MIVINIEITIKIASKSAFVFKSILSLQYLFKIAHSNVTGTVPALFHHRPVYLSIDFFTPLAGRCFMTSVASTEIYYRAGGVFISWYGHNAVSPFQEVSRNNPYSKTPSFPTAQKTL
jgi:hypothetical protein